MLILCSAEALLLVAEGRLRTAPTADKRTQPLQSPFNWCKSCHVTYYLNKKNLNNKVFKVYIFLKAPL